MNYLIALFLMITFAKFFGMIASKIHIPEVVGQIIGGVILGPSVLGLIHRQNIVIALAGLGAALLMFGAGLTCDIDRLKKYFGPGVIVALFGVVLPVGSIYLVCRYFQLSIIESAFIGIVFAATSVSISVAVLEEMKELRSAAGITILAAAVADDIISIVLLSVSIPILGVGHGHGNSDALFLIVLQIVFFLFLWLCYKIVTLLINTIDLDTAKAGVYSFLLCLFLAGTAEMVRLSAVTGAFFAGLIVSQTKFKKVLMARLKGLGTLLPIPIFFVSIGVDMQINGIYKHCSMFLILIVLSVITKFLGAFIGAKLSRIDLANSVEIGAGMISRGEVGIVIAQAGLGSHFISTSYYSTLIAVIVATTILAPLILKPVVLWKRKRESV
ncbi:Na(+)/H(+) antiporter [Apilactobacillus kunkeei]|uniref:cation:proton antiporter n=1 Tax=Apilactobacillus nanyangensis TaxID=2799579 RepID=UPI00110C7326|nr:cation:proton antiporter [Apilactobacillus nanyangensis]TMS99912.1 cation:proton antiporter [Apilactobacillus kunkeei]TMT03262.1 cation:proton antiporter [Apilactobacillus kunkeei]CAI2605020.1 Na(+)/H(+) antiporter [Apilactobacillus kunkeei]